MTLCRGTLGGEAWGSEEGRTEGDAPSLILPLNILSEQSSGSFSTFNSKGEAAFQKISNSPLLLCFQVIFVSDFRSKGLAKKCHHESKNMCVLRGNLYTVYGGNQREGI